MIIKCNLINYFSEEARNLATVDTITVRTYNSKKGLIQITIDDKFAIVSISELKKAISACSDLPD